MGGSDQLFGRLEAEKEGSLPLDLVFFRGDFLFPCFVYLLLPKTIACVRV